MKRINAERLLRLADHLDTVPDEKFDYSTFIRSCGTVGCALWHAATLPEFNALGLSVMIPVDEEMSPDLRYMDDGGDLFDLDVAIHDIFGEESAREELLYPSSNREMSFTPRQVASKFRAFVATQELTD